MITALRASAIRLGAGGVLAFAAAAVALLALPGAATRRERSDQGARAAGKQLEALQAEVRGYQEQAQRLRDDRKVLAGLLADMPSESVGHLQWKFSREVFDLARKDGVHLVSVKFGAPSREGARGSLLEALDVEFAVTGVFKDLKAFMLGLEGSRLPFAVVNAKLDETPDGARLNVVLRAFRQAPGAGPDPGEGT